MANYIQGSYGLKYYKQLTNERGVVVRLEIHQRGYSGSSYEIAALQGLNLVIQGVQDEVDTPIVKTSLRFGILDNTHADGINASGIKGTKKYAYWQEFYTPDSTLYLVNLYRDARKIWAGYLTPDSYTESLDAFGTVSLIARDNLGHLQDFEFDMAGDSYGLVNVIDLIEAACAKICLPMNLQYAHGSQPTLDAADGSCGVTDLQVCVAALEDKDWYEALEGVLDSIGWCMRYDDDANVLCGPLRLWDQHGYADDAVGPEEELAFLGRHSGTRTYAPAWRQIVETADFGQEGDLVLDVLPGKEGTLTTGTAGFWNYYVDAGGNDVEYNGFIGPIVTAKSDAQNGEFYNLDVVKILDDKNYTLNQGAQDSEGAGFHDYLFLGANIGTYSGGTFYWTDVDHYFILKVRSTAVTLKLNFADTPAAFDANGKLGAYDARLRHITYRVLASNAAGTIHRFWDGTTWVTSFTNITKTYDVNTERVTEVEIPLADCPDCGPLVVLDLCIRNMSYAFSPTSILNYPRKGMYARLKNVTYESNVPRIMKSNKVTTIMDTTQNIMAERKPLFNMMPQSVAFVLPRSYQNAFFYYDSSGFPQIAPYLWSWSDDNAGLPFPVKIHQQLLMFHNSTHQVLEGATRPYNYLKDGQPNEMAFDALINYKTTTWMLLVSVTADMLTDRWPSTIVRTFKRYSQLWDGNEVRDDDGNLT